MLLQFNVNVPTRLEINYYVQKLGGGGLGLNGIKLEWIIAQKIKIVEAVLELQARQHW